MKFAKQSNIFANIYINVCFLQVGQSRYKEKYSICNKCPIKFFASRARLTLIQNDVPIPYLIELIPLLLALDAKNSLTYCCFELEKFITKRSPI